MTKLLTVIASLSVITACVANASDAGTESTSAELAQPAAEGDGCVFPSPTWREGNAFCRAFGNGVNFWNDGDSFAFRAIGNVGSGVGTCTVTCTDGVPVQSNCTCHPR